MDNINMTYVLEAVRYKPIALWNLDDTIPFQDYSGYSRTATAGSAPDKYLALVAGASYASIFDAGAIGEFTVPVFVQGKEANSFSLCVSLRTVERDFGDEIQVLSHNGQFDGIAVEGTQIHFSTKYLSAGEAKVTYDTQIPRHVDIVAVHTLDKNSLYIDGVLAGECEITEEQKEDLYVATDGKLYAGMTANNCAVALNGVAVFPHALTAEQASRLYTVARGVVESEAVADMFGGYVISTSQNPLDIFSEQIWQTEEEWNSATKNNVIVEDDQLRPVIENDIVQYGEWLDTFSLSDTGHTSIYGVNINWDGVGSTVEVSLDDTIWETVTRGKNVDLIAPGFDPTDEDLFIRISFADSSDPDSFLDNLSITGMITGEGITTAGRLITAGEPSYVRKEHPAIEIRDDWGIVLQSATLTIGEDTSEHNEVVATREFWLKKLDTSVITLTPADGTTYVNGAAAALSTIREGEWVLVHSVPASPAAGVTTIAGNIIVGQAAVYEDPLTATQIANIYKAYTGQISTRVDDTSTTVVTEPATASNIYAHDWAISPAG